MITNKNLHKKSSEASIKTRSPPASFSFRGLATCKHLSSGQMFTSLGWDTLTRRRETHIVKLVDKCLKGMAPSYFSRYFKLKRHNVHDYDTRKKNKIVIDRVKLESTKRAFFYKGADIFNDCI